MRREVHVMSTHPRISIDPAVCHGRPVVAGTRVPVAVITGGLAGGMTIEEVVREYDVSVADVQAALASQRRRANRTRPDKRRTTWRS